MTDVCKICLDTFKKSNEQILCDECDKCIYIKCNNKDSGSFSDCGSRGRKHLRAPSLTERKVFFCKNVLEMFGFLSKTT